jgi:ABC-2 type transport system permease protein
MRLLRETALVAGYELRRAVRNPVWVLMGTFQPVLWLLLFVPLLSEMAVTPPGSDDLEVFVPGVLTMLAILSTLLAGFGFLALLRTGVLERLLVTSASRLALALGRVVTDVAGLLAQSVFLLAVALLMGFRASPVSVLLIFAVMVLLGLSVASLSYALALNIRDERAFSSVVNFCALPLMLLSGVLVPLSFAPGWMETAGEANPLRYAVDAVRALAADDRASGDVTVGFLVLGALTVLTVTWAARSYRRVVT